GEDHPDLILLEESLQGIQIHPLRTYRYTHQPNTGRFENAPEARVSRVLAHDRVARRHQRVPHQVERLLAAAGDQDLVELDGDAVPPHSRLQIFLQRRIPIAPAVLLETSAHATHHRVLDASNEVHQGRFY